MRAEPKQTHNNMHRFDSSVAEIAPLAWLYICQPGKESELIHGRDVDVFDEGFFEGCYSGDWESRNFDQVGQVFGSGMRLRDGFPIFVTPSHTLEALYVYRDKEKCAISNSLLAIISHFNLVVPYDRHHGARFTSTCHGIDSYESLLIQLPTASISRVIYDNFSLAQSGAISKIRKCENLSFQDFVSYKSALTDTLSRAFQNAQEVSRKARYIPITTVSSGYDSVCCAALAKDLGCNEAITLSEARKGFGSCGGNDSGAPIAKSLGMKVTEMGRVDKAENCLHLMMMLATGMGGEDYSLEPFSHLLPGRVLLTGYSGDTIWSISAQPNAHMAKGDTNGADLQEFRVQLGFIHVPVPMIAARKHADIIKVSQSEEMRPYRIGGDYDRPIPRRIVEEHGVPRSAFGQSKKATILLFLADPAGMFSAEIMAEIRRTQAQVCSTFSKRLDFRIRAVTFPLRHFAYRAARKIAGLRWMQPWIVRDWMTFGPDHPLAGVLFLTAIRILRTGRKS